MASKSVRSPVQSDDLSEAAYLSLLPRPYSETPHIILTDKRMVRLQAWLDENRLLVETINEAGQVGLALVTTSGEMMELTPLTPVVGVLR